MGFSGKVNDRADLLIAEQACHQSGVTDIPVNEPVGWVRIYPAEILEIPCIGELIQIRDPIIRMARDPAANKISANKSSSACY